MGKGREQREQALEPSREARRLIQTHHCTLLHLGQDQVPRETDTHTPNTKPQITESTYNLFSNDRREGKVESQYLIHNLWVSFKRKPSLS